MLAMLFCLSSYAQICAPNNITTNPATPVNNQVPIKTNTFFNWQNPSWPVFTNYTVPGELIESPFFQLNNSIINNLVVSGDMKADEGWELTHYGFGYNNNGSAQNPTIDNPWLVLYNKYQGLLRVLVARGSNQVFQGAKISLGFTNESTMQTSLLDLVKEPDALEQFFTREKISAVSEFNNEMHKWFYADFVTQYDPCTCYYSSELVASVSLINNSTITLQGAATGTLTSISNNQGTVSQPNSTRSFKDILSGGKKAYEVYKSVDKFKSSHKDILNIYKNLSQITQNQQVFLDEKKDLFSTALKKSGFLRNGLASAPYIGAAVSLVDFFIGGGKKDVPVNDEVKLSPLSLEMSIKLDGSINTSSNYNQITFTNPGSVYNTATPLGKYPYYNEVMGVFNLLNRPKVYNYNYYDILDENGMMNMTEKNRLLLKEPIKYALNPGAGLQVAQIGGVPDIQFAYIVEGAWTAAAYGYTTPVDYGPGDFGAFEGVNAITGLKQFRTDYRVLSELNTYSPYFESRENSLWFSPNKYYIKFLINLQRTSGAGTSQNLLFVAKYPLATTYSYIDNYSSGQSIFNTTPLVAATTPEITTFCNSAPYTNNYQNGGHFNRRSGSDSITQVVPILSTKFELTPNPGKDFSIASFTIEKASAVTIQINDINGRLVSAPFNFRIMQPGNYTKQINLQSLAKGIYLISIRIGDRRISRKLLKI